MRVTSGGDTGTRIGEQQREKRGDAWIARCDVGDLDADIDVLVIFREVEVACLAHGRALEPVAVSSAMLGVLLIDRIGFMRQRRPRQSPR